MDAMVLRCSACGGALPEGIGRCPYCAATVASRHCLACFHANLESAVHCAACGRELGLEPVADDAPLACPGCGDGTHLQAIPAGEVGSVKECPKCAGQFVDHDTLRALFAERIAAGVKSARPPQNNTLGPVRYLPCPTCGVRMNRKNFGERSGVIVDVCRQHGIWFDRGELPRVLAFVESGGLILAEAREEARKRELKREAAAAAAFVANVHAVDRHADERDPISEIFRLLLS
jgi:Zn-finger nucleic acid-binding protein